MPEYIKTTESDLLEETEKLRGMTMNYVGNTGEYKILSDDIGRKSVSFEPEADELITTILGALDVIDEAIGKYIEFDISGKRNI